MPPENQYSLQDLADLADVSPRTIRYYVAQGLLPSPGQVGPGAHYADGHLARLRLIRRLQREHLPLAEIRTQLSKLDDETIAALAEAEAPAPPDGSALDYVRSVLGGPGVTGRPAIRSDSLVPPASRAILGIPLARAQVSRLAELSTARYEPSPPVAPEPPADAAAFVVGRVTLPSRAPAGRRGDPRARHPALPVGPHRPHARYRTQHPSAPEPPAEQAGRAPHRDRPRAPRGGPVMTFTARTDRHFIRPTYRSNRFVLAEIDAPPARRERARPPVHLAFVIDRSGSMAGDKIRLAKLAVEESLARLHDDDRFAIVVYDEVIDVVFPSTRATADARRSALARLGEIDARGSTNLGEGWLRGCEQVALALSAEGVNRTLLLTDGLANVGMTDRDELARHAAELRARGVSTTTFGVGEDFDEVLLQAMADAGGGHFYFIANAAAIRDHVTSEVGETLEIVARDVTLQVSAPDGIEVESLSPFPTQAFGGRTVVTLGDLVAEQRLQVVLRLNFPYGETGRDTGALLSLSDRDGVLDGAPVKLGLGVRRQQGERPPGPRPRRRPGGRPDLRIEGPPGGDRPQPGRRLPGREGGALERRPPDPRLRRPGRAAPRDRRRARPGVGPDGRPDGRARPEAGVLRQRQHGKDAHARRHGYEGTGRRRALIQQSAPRR